jgi:hypothetical protein
MTMAHGEPLLSSDSDVEVHPWQFLIDASRVSFGMMASLASPTTATSTSRFSVAW